MIARSKPAGSRAGHRKVEHLDPIWCVGSDAEMVVLKATLTGREYWIELTHAEALKLREQLSRSIDKEKAHGA